MITNEIFLGICIGVGFTIFFYGIYQMVKLSITRGGHP